LKAISAHTTLAVADWNRGSRWTARTFRGALGGINLDPPGRLNSSCDTYYTILRAASERKRAENL